MSEPEIRVSSQWFAWPVTETATRRDKPQPVRVNPEADDDLLTALAEQKR